MPDGTAAFEKPITDQWIHAELNLPQGELLRKAKVIGRTKDGNGDVIGSYDPNPFLNALTYLMLRFLVARSKIIRTMS